MKKLEATDLVVRYGTGRHGFNAVDGMTFSVDEGKTLGVVGESGCGKSTVARAILGLVPIASGALRLDGRDHTSLDARNSREYRRRVQMVFQDPYSSLDPRMTIRETIGEALRQREMGAAERRREGERVLDLVGLGRAVVDRYPHQFSGGQRQRIAIARALAVAPQVLVLDEVTSALDVSVQATILNLIKDVQRELGLTLVFISHDLSVVRYVSDNVVVMYLGQRMEEAETVSLFDRPQHPYTQGLIKSIPRLDALLEKAPLGGDIPDPRHPPRGCRFHTRCPLGPKADPERTACVETSPQEIAGGKTHTAACHFV